VEDERKGRALGADEYFLKPVDRSRLLARLAELVGAGHQRILVVDDDETARYILRRLLGPRVVLEAAGGVEGLRLARQHLPSAILLDLAMPDKSGFEVLDELKSVAETAKIPVIIVTSKSLTAAEAARLAGKAETILSKNDLSLEKITSALNRLASAAEQ
jgi:CheY-like chemotaxis protein